MSKLVPLGEFIPSEVMVNIYKAFILPHLEYCAPVLVGLSSDLASLINWSLLISMPLELFWTWLSQTHIVPYLTMWD